MSVLGSALWDCPVGDYEKTVQKSEKHLRAVGPLFEKTFPGRGVPMDIGAWGEWMDEATCSLTAEDGPRFQIQVSVWVSIVPAILPEYFNPSKRR